MNVASDAPWQHDLWSNAFQEKGERSGPVRVDLMEAYMRDIGEWDVNSAEQSNVCALQIMYHRAQMRRALFSHIPVAKQSLALIDLVTSGQLPASRTLNAPSSGAFDAEHVEKMIQVNVPTIRDLIAQVEDGMNRGAGADAHEAIRLEHMRQHIGVLVDELGIKDVDSFGNTLMTAAHESTVLGKRIFSTRDPMMKAALQQERADFLLNHHETASSLSQRAKRYREEKAQYLAARDLLVTGNLRMAIHVAKKYANGIDMIDLISEGNLGLLRAAEKFEPHQGNNFSTYAMWWIMQGIGRAQAEQSRTVRVPHHILTSAIDIKKVENTLTQKLGRKPTTQELADVTKQDIDTLSRHRRSFQTPLSLNFRQDDDNEFGSMFVDRREATVDKESEDMERRALLAKALHLLHERERAVLTYRYGLDDGVGHTLEETGEIFKVTRERIRQIEARSLEKMRSRITIFGMDSIREFNGDGNGQEEPSTKNGKNGHTNGHNGSAKD